MRKFIFIFIVSLAYLVLSSKSCGTDEKDDAAKKEAELIKTKARIKNEFESDDLSKKSLKAFEVKAKQKLVDFSDYLGICSDKQMDESFKNQARQMILDLFISDSIRVNGLLINEKEENNIPINKFLNSDFGYGNNSMDFVFDSIEVEKPLRRTDEFNYVGNLNFSRRVKVYSPSDTLCTGPAKMEVEILASKVKKIFGADTLQVWGVFLGNIK